MAKEHNNVPLKLMVAWDAVATKNSDPAAALMELEKAAQGLSIARIILVEAIKRKGPRAKLNQYERASFRKLVDLDAPAADRCAPL